MSSFVGVAASGNQLQTQNTSNGWAVVDAISQQTYQNGATFSCRFPVGAAAMAGMTTPQSPAAAPYDPTAGGLGLYGFLWYAHADVGAVLITEIINGVSSPYIVQNSSALATDVFSVEYDGYYARYYYNGVLSRTSPPVPNLTLAAYFTGFEAGNMAADVYFASVPQATPNPFLATGNCVTHDSAAQKIGGVTAWDSGIYSINGYTACRIHGKNSPTSFSGVTNQDVMIGLSQKPTSSSSFIAADFAIRNNGGANYQIFENAALILTVAGVTPFYTDFLLISYDGTTVDYWINDVLVHSTAAAGLTLYAFCPFNSVGAALNSLSFGPSTQADTVPTHGMDPNAAGTIGSNFSAAAVVCGAGVGNTHDTDVISLTVTTTGAPVEVDGFCNFAASHTNNAVFNQALFSIYMDGTIISSAQYDATQESNRQINSADVLPVTLTVTNAPPLGSHTFTLHAHVSIGGTLGVGQVSCTNNFIKVREIKR
jgi:hypothetical protein